MIFFYFMCYDLFSLTQINGEMKMNELDRIKMNKRFTTDLWKDFFNNYIDVIINQLTNTIEYKNLENTLDFLTEAYFFANKEAKSLRKTEKTDSNKLISKQNKLDVWFEKTTEKNKFAPIYKFLSEKNLYFLKTDPIIALNL